ncbi:MAG TPA: hypothetical protein VF581_08205 [Flavobacterium sp.]
MKEKLHLVEELLEKAQDLAKTNAELYKLKAIDKASDIFASVASGAVLGIIGFFILVLTTIAGSLYLGELLGKPHHGFFAMAGIYALLGIFILVFKKPWIDKTMNNFIINQIFKDKRDASNKR